MTVRIINISRGFSLIEVLAVIVILGIVAGTVLNNMTNGIDDIRKNETLDEMEGLAAAIVGDPDATQQGRRVDFGYVGDIGSFPAELDNLLENPGGYVTWDGPYLPERFLQDSLGFKLDGWGQAYQYDGGVVLASAGGAENLTRRLALSPADYLDNRVTGIITDADDSLPGVIYADSITLAITVPDGVGGRLTRSYSPDATGAFIMDTIPAGIHPVELVFIPGADTLSRLVTVFPRHHDPLRFKFTGAWFAGGTFIDGIAKVNGSDSLYNDCHGFFFWVENNSGAAITITSITLTWSGPTAFYRYIKWDGAFVFNRNNPKVASGETAILNTPQTIDHGEQLRVDFDFFKSQATGGPNVDMNDIEFSVTFSDGSEVTVTTGGCP